MASTKIGFNLVSFSYNSLVSYKNPIVPVKITRLGQEWWISSVSASSTIFNNLESTWSIKNTAPNTCTVDYRIKMEFANSLYASVTRQFFDFLVTNINAKFRDRCAEVGEQSYRHELDDSNLV